jgi:hypothetical protein
MLNFNPIHSITKRKQVLALAKAFNETTERRTSGNPFNSAL